jgi:hypothetical protein
MAGGPSMAGDGGSPHRDHHSSPRLILRKEKLRANSNTLRKTNHVNHTRRTATRGGGAIAAPSASFKTTTRTTYTQRNSLELKRRRMQSHQCHEVGPESTQRLHPRATVTSNHLNPKPSIPCGRVHGLDEKRKLEGQGVLFMASIGRVRVRLSGKSRERRRRYSSSESGSNTGGGRRLTCGVQRSAT